MTVAAVGAVLSPQFTITVCTSPASGSLKLPCNVATLPSVTGPVNPSPATLGAVAVTAAVVVCWSDPPCPSETVTVMP